MYKLIPHQSCHSHPSFEIKAILHVEDKIIFEFSVKGSISLEKKSQFSKTPYKNWGLWKEDVVELFIRRVGETSYLEVQANPFGYGFELIIIRPRELFYTPIHENIEIECSLEKNLWQGKIEIPNTLIPGSGESFEGGMFAILGNPREHYALNPNPEKIPDYHRPDLFIGFS